MISYYYKYYLEIKNRFILITVSWIFTITICYLYKESLLFILIDSNNFLIETPEKPYFIFTNITEVFYVYIELSLFISNQIGLLGFCYHTLMFLSLGLYRFEFIKLKFAFKIFVLSWLVSALLLYKLIIPLSWNFFLSFQQNSNETQPVSLFFEAKLMEYFHYLTGLYYICLINCQFLAMLLILLTNLNEKMAKTKTFRKLFYIIFVIFSTITTPPDIFSQIIVSLLLITIYEVLLFLKQIKINKVTN